METNKNNNFVFNWLDTIEQTTKDEYEVFLLEKGKKSSAIM